MTEALIEPAIRLAIGVIIAILLYRDSRSRDYSWLLWTLAPIAIIIPGNHVVAFAVGLLIILIYLISRPKGDLRKCPHCKRRVHSILAFCPFCGKSVKKECLHCHETVDWEETRCPHCRSTNLTES